MNTALMYCNKNFIKSLKSIKENKALYEAFDALEQEIKKLECMDQLHLYSVTTQFLESLKRERDSINPLDVFILRCNSIFGVENETSRKIGLALAVIAISLSVVVLAGATGLGIGMLLGLWQTAMLFMTAFLAVETASLIVASTSVALGIGAGLVSGILFFKESKVKNALNTCVEAVKQSHLSESLPSGEEEDTTRTISALHPGMDKEMRLSTAGF